MENFDKIISSLYNNYLLRDFAGKIIPGSTVSICFIYLFYPDMFNAILHNSNSYLISLYYVFFAWIIGIAVESASFTRWRSYLRKKEEDPTKENEKNASHSEVEFMKVATDRDKSKYERLYVIEKAARTSAVSIIFCVIFACIHKFFMPMVSPGYVCPDMFNFIILLLFSLYISFELFNSRKNSKRHLENHIQAVMKSADREL